MIKTDAVGLWLDACGRKDPLEPAEVLPITAVIQDPDASATDKRAAYDRLLRHNLGLVALVTQRYLKSRAYLQPDDDRIYDYLQQGALGLMHAGRKFDPERQCRFSTYAVPWIRSYVGKHHYRRAISDTVHIPENVAGAILNKRSTKKLEKFIMAAAPFYGMDSLDRMFSEDNNQKAPLIELLRLEHVNAVR